MVKSMTGYGRAQEVLDGRDITVEIRAVNHRYFEYSSRLPRSLGFLDDRLKKLVQGSVSRGKIDVGVLMLSTGEDAGASVAINKPLAEQYVHALRSLGQELSLTDDITLSSISRFNDIFMVSKTQDDEDQLWEDVKKVADAALDRFLAMRTVEGESLKSDILGRLVTIEEAVAKVE